MHVGLVSWGVGISFPFFDRKEDDLTVQDITFIKLELSPLELKLSSSLLQQFLLLKWKAK